MSELKRAVRSQESGERSPPSTLDPRPVYFVGVDGGATKTTAVVVDAAGRERGRGTAGSSNQAAVGLERAVAAVQAAVAEATRAIGGPEALAVAWIGLAGVDRPGDREAMLAHLGLLAGAVRLTNDGELVLSALPGGVGVAAIAGTGSITIGRDPGGKRVRAGGWGHLIGDEGSGWGLGRGALQAAARAADGRGPGTALLDAVLRHWDLTDPSEIIGRVYHREDKATIARLSALVFAAARDGDAVARNLVAQAAAEIALGIRAVAEALDLAEGPLPLALAGGLLAGTPEFRAAALRRVRRWRPVDPVVVVAEPAASAARAAISLNEAEALAVDPTVVHGRTAHQEGR